MGEIKSIFEEEMANPSEEFVKFFASRAYKKGDKKGMLTPNVKDLFAELIKNTFKQLVNDKINDRLKSALVKEELSTLEIPVSEGPTKPEDDIPRKIVTTEEEIQGYNLVKSILGEIIDPERVYIKDRLNFCGINLDDNQQKPICKLYFNEPQKFIGLFDKKKNEKSVKIDALEDINKYAEKLKSVVEAYDASKEEPEETEKTKINFVFNGKEYEVKYWKDMYLQICGLMATNHKDRFEDILNLSGRKNAQFSKNPSDLRIPKLIEGTDIYAEVGFGSRYLEGLSKKVIKHFGDSEESLIIKQSA